jgi:predicted small metal-binding protein
MKTFACKNLGLDCDFISEGDVEEEILADALSHIEETHGHEISIVEENPEDLPETVRTYILDDEI